LAPGTAPAMQLAELQFAQRLASHEKGIRDRAVKKLRQYISVKTQRETGGFSQEELLKIWKGLFYCMWVQDEPLLQEELANTISQLVHVVNNSEAQHLFIQTFWQTMNREWKGIDRLRLGKYYMLIRLVLRQSFEVLKRHGWEESRIKLFLDVLMKEILHPESQSPNGVKFHFIDIYLDELSKVGGKELLADQNLKFIDPFCKIAAKTKDQTLVQTIARGVLEVIVDQSPFGPEETLEERKTQSGCGLPAGLCFVALLAQFDYKAVADRLLEITNKKNIPPFNRKRLSKLIKKFQDLSEGSLSQLSFAEEASADEDEQALSRGKHKKKGNKLEKTELEKETGEPRSSADKAGRRAAWVRVGPRRPLLWLKRKDADCVIFGAPTVSLPRMTSPLVPSLTQEGGDAFSPSKKQQLRPENDFVKFDTPFLPKPLFFRRAKSSAPAASAPRAVQRDKTPSSSKKVTFGLNRNMTAEFKKTDKSILVSPTGPSRVAFNPEQRPLHGVLKTPTSSPTSSPLGTKKLLTATPKRRPTAADFF
uniref:Ribosomal RNA processing 1B n=1 Tax=Ailuropoda melanoleuca TaxID=9646 RepID=A0A7N5KKX2_AILME